MTDMPHLTEREIAQFRERELSGAALVAVTDHLAGCGPCRTRLAQAGALAAAHEALSRDLAADDPHIPDDDVHAYVDGRLDAAARRAVEIHAGRCAQCAAEIRDLQTWFGGGTAAPSRRSYWVSALAAAAALVLAAGLYAWLRPPASPPWMVLADGSATIQVNREGRLTNVDGLTASDAAEVRAALVSRTLAVPPAIAALAAKGGELRGDATTPSFTVTAPRATAVRSDRPTFTWTTLPGTARYIVRLRDERGGDTIASPTLTATEWTPAVPLVRGHTYEWQVAATFRGEESVAPQPPAPPARFVVLDAATAARLDRAPASHLVRGILYADAGVLDDAARELAALRSQNHASDALAALADQIDRLKRR